MPGQRGSLNEMFANIQKQHVRQFGTTNQTTTLTEKGIVDRRAVAKHTSANEANLVTADTMVKVGANTALGNAVSSIIEDEELKREEVQID